MLLLILCEFWHSLAPKERIVCVWESLKFVICGGTIFSRSCDKLSSYLSIMVVSHVLRGTWTFFDRNKLQTVLFNRRVPGWLNLFRCWPTWPHNKFGTTAPQFWAVSCLMVNRGIEILGWHRKQLLRSAVTSLIMRIIAPVY